MKIWIVNPLKDTIQTYSFEGEENSVQYAFKTNHPCHHLQRFQNLYCRFTEIKIYDQSVDEIERKYLF